MPSLRMLWWWPLVLPLSVVLGTTQPDICPISPSPISPFLCPLVDDLIPNSPPSGWFQGDDCVSLGLTTFCSFTNPSFDSSNGLSIITTPSRLHSTLAALPSLLQQQPPKPSWGNKNNDDKSSPPFRPETLPDKHGIGLVATRRITTGELVLARTPAVMVDDEGFHGLGRGPLTQLLRQAVEGLPEVHRKEYLALSTHGEVVDGEKVYYEVFARNNMRVRMGNETGDFHATFVDVSRLNHACRPNCGYQFDVASFSQKVFAARDVPRNEELTISYIDPIQTRDKRRAQLQKSWGFTCTCPACAAPDADTADSDARIQRIQQLWADLDDYDINNTASEQQPEKGEELVALYEQEGLKTRIHEAYYRAAIAWNAVGNSTSAARYALLSILRGQVFAGAERPFVKEMKELLRAPEEHWTWRFRVKEGEGDAGGDKREESGVEKDEL